MSSEQRTSFFAQYFYGNLRPAQGFYAEAHHYSIICNLLHEWTNSLPPWPQTIQALQNRPMPQPMVQQSVSFAQKKNLNAGSPISSSSEASSMKVPGKSIFHNFQKHLKTLLKKVIVLDKTELASLPSGIPAYRLWNIFKQQRNSSKQILYIIFGAEEQENLASLTEAAKQNQKIGQMLSFFQISQIQGAQRLLREKVTDQIKLLPQEQLKSLCKITRFDEFYVYFKVFMDELREGGISRRITKVRKTRFMGRSTLTAE